MVWSGWSGLLLLVHGCVVDVGPSLLLLFSGGADGADGADGGDRLYYLLSPQSGHLSIHLSVVLSL